MTSSYGRHGVAILAVQQQDQAAANDVTWMMNVPKAPFWYVVDVILWICSRSCKLFVTVQTLTGHGADQARLGDPAMSATAIGVGGIIALFVLVFAASCRWPSP